MAVGRSSTVHLVPPYKPGLSLRSVTHNTCLWLSMYAGPLMLGVNLLVVDTIHPQRSKFVAGVKIKAAGDLKLIDCPVNFTPLNRYKTALL